jgi:hypothetical protein
MKPRTWSIKPAKRHVACDCCGKKGNATRAYRLNPRNFHEEIRLLCHPCQKKLGFAPMTFNRAWSEHGSVTRRNWG